MDYIPALKQSLLVIGTSLDRVQADWLLGGSCSLLLQGVKLDKAPRDIDIYTDTDSIHKLHQQLDSWAKDTPRLDEEGMYKSVLSHYVIEDYSVELVGGFEVTSLGSVYEVRVSDLLREGAPVHMLQDVPIHLMPLSHELVFNVLRNRKDRYEAIAEVMRRNPELHFSLMNQIISQNTWESSHLEIIQQLTDMTL